MKDEQFIQSLRKLENIFTKQKILTPEEHEDFTDNIENLEESSINMKQAADKSLNNYEDYLSLMCEFNISIVDTQSNLLDIYKLLNTLDYRIKE